MKTARFAEIVNRCGAPETYLLWVAPKQDKVFQRHVAEHRVMTIHSETTGSKKDFGTVGFVEDPNAQYLLFPKSLKRFTERRIVGINYELLKAETRSAAKPKPSPAPTKKAAPPAPPKPSAPEKKVVPFESSAEKREEAPRKPAPAPSEPPRKDELRAQSKPRLDPAVLRELKKAVAELRAGKAVPAYERLEALVKANDGGE